MQQNLKLIKIENYFLIIKFNKKAKQKQGLTIVSTQNIQKNRFDFGRKPRKQKITNKKEEFKEFNRQSRLLTK